MKKGKIVSLILSLLMVFMLPSCESRNLGNLSNSYIEAKDGKDGSSLLNGQGTPYATLGNDGDSYIDTTTWDYYTKSSGVWTKVGNIKGADGAKGDKGEDGKDGAIASKGEDGLSLLTGEGAPYATLGNDGDSYIDTTTWNYYSKTNGNWIKVGNIKGKSGSSGSDGRSITKAEINDEGHLIITYSDGTTYDAGNTNGNIPDYLNKTYTVNFYIENTIVKTYEVGFADRITDPCDDESFGWVVGSWMPNPISDSDRPWDFYRDHIFEDTNLYAWEDSEHRKYWYAKTPYTYILDANGGTCSDTSIVLTRGNSYSLPTSTHSEHKFIGWYIGNNPIRQTGDCWDWDGDEILVAHYTDTYILDPNGGICNMSTIELGRDYSYSLPTPTKDDEGDYSYVFIGWFYKDFRVQQSSTWDYEDNIRTIVAKWTKIKSKSFGSYPQSEIKDSNLTSILTTKVGFVPTSSNSYDWTSYKYYMNGSNVIDFMWYKDVIYNNDKYRAVYFTRYRPCYCSYSSSEHSSYQKNNGYTTNTIYWFKFEPIVWRVLETNDDYSLVVSNQVLDSHDYYHDSNYKGVGSPKRKARESYDSTITASVYDNNYKYSDIRGWLNTCFYETAFDSVEQANINTTEIDNSLNSTKCEKRFICENTNDKVLLLSYSELSNESYFCDEDDKKTFATDYAKCQGVYTDYYFSDYWLRSPSNSSANYYVDYHGQISETFSLDYCLGIRPAIKISTTEQ